MPSKTRTSDGRDPNIERYLADKGVTWEFMSDVSVGGFDYQKSMQNQARLNKLIPSQVETYVEAMNRGDQFPPIIARRSEDNNKYITIDGNHRLEAARRLGRTVNVYIASGDPKQLTLMTFEANAKHGMPSSPAERVIHALWLVDTGLSRIEAAAQVGAKATDVDREWRRREADRRSDSVGIPRTKWEILNQAVRTRLLGVQDDDVFKKATELAHKANLGTEEVQDLVAQLNEHRRSVNRQLAILKALETGEYAERIAGGAAIFGTRQRQNRNTPKARANQIFTLVAGLPDNPTALVSFFSDAEREIAAKKAREAVDKISALAEALESA